MKQVTLVYNILNENKNTTEVLDTEYIRNMVKRQATPTKYGRERTLDKY